MKLPQLILPDSLNYIGAFLTFDCNLNCSYCINDPQQRGDRKKVFEIREERLRTEMTPEEWIRALRRIPQRDDLPVTFQGGEPMLYWKGWGLGAILSGTDNYADLLTNFALPAARFSEGLTGQHRKLQRQSPYPPIRVSLHVKEMDRLWGNGFDELVSRCIALKDHGFIVSDDPAESNIGIYVVDHPENVVTEGMREYCRGKIPFFMKDFLGVFDGELSGQYGYPYSTDLVSSGTHPETLDCECRPTELLIDPLGFVWPCHFYLYRAWETGATIRAFQQIEEFRFNFSTLGFGGSLRPTGHLLDPAFTMKEASRFHHCAFYGRCIGCDTKLKRDRFGTENVYRSSVIIKNIQWPESLRNKVSNDYTRKA